MPVLCKLFVLTFGAVTILVNRSILAPLAKLALLAKSLQQGDYDYPLTIKTGDELERLSLDFRYMAMVLKEQRATLLTEKDMMSLVLSNIADGVVALNASYNVYFSNQAALKILGVEVDKNHAVNLNEVLRLQENGNDVTLQQLCEHAGEKPAYHKLSFLTNDGQQKNIHIIIAPLKESPVTPIRYIVTLYDLTKQEEFEKMKLDFVSMAAHELRTPLTSIRGYLSILQEETVEKLTAEQTTFLQRIMVSADQLQTLVENLLNISQIEKGKLELKLAPVDLEKTVLSIIDNLTPEAKQRNIELSYDKPDHTIPSVNADEFRINEVITNLISNAIHYNRQDGWIKVSLKEQENTVVVSVSDGGVGIPESALPNLFTKFYRITTPLEMGAKGTGLGLFISKQIIEAHKGKIWVESEVDKGTTFHFSLEKKH
jgi:signal transduction histidine kinase